jgi:NADP-dependent 3-hydroxy acid dehydrogenase YdfG
VKPVLLITGAESGLGKALANSLSENWRLILCDKAYKYSLVTQSQIIKPCDVSKISDVKEVVSIGLKKFGRIDILINNAGLMLFDKFENIKEDDIDAMYNVNIKGTLLFSQAVLPIMRKQKSGYIINISSTRGITGAPNKGAYAVTKFGVRALAETLFQENEQYGIKTTSICPGKLDKKLVTHEDIINTIKYLLKLGPKAYVKEIIIGGQL